MAPKIFLTGVTGYIAGDCLYALTQTHPEYSYAALVRTKVKADIVAEKYPSVRVVLGDLDDDEILKREAGEADVVLHAADASDHEGAAKAIIAGLVEGHSKEKPGFLLHTGGTGILTYTDAAAGCKGTWSEKEYNDWDGVSELTNLPDHAFHRNVDKIVLEAGEKYGDVLKTALICPPTIYGKGRGPVSGRGRQVYEMAKLILAPKYIPIVGEGMARWNNIHIEDLTNVYLLLIEAALSNSNSHNDSEIWGPRAYYLTEHGEHIWSEVAVDIAKVAQGKGYLGQLEKMTLSREEALQQAGFEAESWGMNSRGKAVRAGKVLGWKARQMGLSDSFGEIVEEEYERLKSRG